MTSIFPNNRTAVCPNWCEDTHDNDAGWLNEHYAEVLEIRLPEFIGEQTGEPLRRGGMLVHVSLQRNDLVLEDGSVVNGPRQHVVWIDPEPGDTGVKLLEPFSDDEALVIGQALITSVLRGRQAPNGG